MYRYDEFDAEMVSSRVAQFKAQVERRLSGALSEAEFRPLRLMNGLYLQLHAYMLRVAVPYGTLNSKQMRKLADLADKYDRGYGHITTRQNVQFNWPELTDVPDMLKELASVEMHAIQTSGNCIRNVTSDPYAGAIADEIEDPRPTCEILRQWSTLHPEFAFLPRKFKIAVIASKKDRALIRAHDIGLEIIKNDAGEIGYRVYVGGGLGRTPVIGQVLRDFLPRVELLPYLEATLRIYNRYGRRDNKFKARIKILVQETGIEDFRTQVEAEYAELVPLDISVSPEEVARITQYFSPPDYKDLKDIEVKTDDPAFARWLKHNVLENKTPGYSIVNISLKPKERAPGDVTSEQMRIAADLADEFSFSEIRTTHQQNLVLPYVETQELENVYKKLVAAKMAEGNIGLITDIICCPGMDFCSLATARSIPVSQAIAERFWDAERQAVIGEMQIKISGCINACGHHHVGHIGILGLEKAGVEFYQVKIGGDPSENTALGQITGPGFSQEELIDGIERMVDHYIEIRENEERFIDTVRRAGVETFKEVLYVDA
ncbi:nitrite/sulfite reductase [Litorimonas haliclonae]|uniref:nitrite/sulfite reductase n=1 Tax=Litorimonas haliclonae TaxID=2081977 RepID=UPI0039EE3A98